MAELGSSSIYGDLNVVNKTTTCDLNTGTLTQTNGLINTNGLQGSIYQLVMSNTSYVHFNDNGATSTIRLYPTTGIVCTTGCFVGNGSGLTNLTPTNLSQTRNTTSYTICSSTGTNTALAAATTSLAGVMTSADKTKLDGIAAGAQVNVGTNLGTSYSTTTVTITSSTGNNTSIAAATASDAGIVTNTTQTFGGTKITTIWCGTSCARGSIVCAVTAFRTSGTGLGICGGTSCGSAVDWIATSDCRVKKNITPISSALSKVNALCGVYYELCEDGTPDMGLIAQDVFCVEPRLVTKDEPTQDDIEKYDITDEKLGLKYDKFAGLFVEAIKELTEQNIYLQNQINELNNK